ncbi:hypothetical protein AAFF_G00190150 [Aldrovandia affinis]|uniref:Uncharacterized protein n=1 Tax=Aldrovandia affinis TaxID=143900 RepID=A0AAD7W766_9TELE|nr:hypothetical protein AAFF_G00190150 [Aldrovandia affinis]
MCGGGGTSGTTKPFATSGGGFIGRAVGTTWECMSSAVTPIRPGRGPSGVRMPGQAPGPLAQPATEAADEAFILHSPRDSPGVPGGAPKRPPWWRRALPHFQDFVMDGGVAGDNPLWGGYGAIQVGR